MKCRHREVNQLAQDSTARKQSANPQHEYTLLLQRGAIPDSLPCWGDRDPWPPQSTAPGSMGMRVGDPCPLGFWADSREHSLGPIKQDEVSAVIEKRNSCGSTRKGVTSLFWGNHGGSPGGGGIRTDPWMNKEELCLQVDWMSLHSVGSNRNPAHLRPNQLGT